MTSIAKPPGVLAEHAGRTRAMGSPFVAAVLDAGDRHLSGAPRVAALIEGWPGDVAADAVAMRFNGALHALARRGSVPELTALYRDRCGDFDRVIGAAMMEADVFIADWMRDPPQTNEVGRAAAIMAALMALRDRCDMPCDLLELGASAGLNLNLARYAYDLGGVAAGVATSPVRIAPVWRGPPPPVRPVEIASARGVDLQPLDVTDAAARERLMAFTWADDPARADRLARALDLACEAPPAVACGDIVAWLPAELAAPQRAGTCRVVVHSMALQYLDPANRVDVERALAEAGARASRDRPLARIAFEWTDARDEVRLLLTTWPHGEVRHLATCHAYGAWVEWHPDGEATHPRPR